MTGSSASQIAAELNAVLGEGTVKVGSDESLAIRYLPTGVLPIDVLLQGGVPRGRMTEIFGAYSTLKSYVALRTIATTQATGGVCALVDTEHSYDPDWLRELGGDPDNLIVQRPLSGEQAVETSEVLIRSGVDLLVWDSVAATITKSQMEKRASDDTQPARLAAFMSRALPRLTAVNSGDTAMLWINQTRINVGVTFGSPEVTPGGKALPFFASYRMKFSKAGKVTEDVKVWDGEKFSSIKQGTVQKIKCTLEKSKLNSPDREHFFAFDLKTGQIDEVGFLIAQGLERGLITMTNSRWALPHWSTTAHGAAKFRAALTPKDIEWLKTEVISPGASGARRAVKKKVGPRKRSL